MSIFQPKPQDSVDIRFLSGLNKAVLSWETLSFFIFDILSRVKLEPYDILEAF